MTGILQISADEYHADPAPAPSLSSAPSIDMLHKLLICDAENGKLYWRERGAEMFSEGNRGAQGHCRSWNSRFAGKEAICSAAGSHGYLDGAIQGRGVLAHRVIWAMTYGRWPVGIDHINGSRRDNRIANLREAAQAENMLNFKLRSDNPSGVPGVWKLDGSGDWRARIKRAGIMEDLGRFSTKEAATAARREAEVRLGFHQNHGRSA